MRDVYKRVGTVQHTLIQEQMLIGQEFSGLNATVKTILDRLPAEVSYVIMSVQCSWRFSPQPHESSRYNIHTL